MGIEFCQVAGNYGAFFALDRNPTFGTPNYVAPGRQVQPALRLNF
jgi:hypothetical protein